MRTGSSSSISFGCADRCDERLTIELPFEMYLRGMGEMPSSWPGAALRSQVVAARTFATYKIRQYGLRSDCDCHLADGAGDQVYVGWSKESRARRQQVGRRRDRHRRRDRDLRRGRRSRRSTRLRTAVTRKTSRTCGTGGTPPTRSPTFAVCAIRASTRRANPWTDWTRSFTASNLSSRLSPYTGGIGTISRFTDVRRGVSGRIVSAIARGSGGSASVAGSELRAALGLPDGRVWINRDRNVVGAVRAKYDALMCRPGLPRSTVLVLDHGSRQLFQRGGIYRNGECQPHGLAARDRSTPSTSVPAVPAAVSGSRWPRLPVLSERPAAETCAGCRQITLEGGRIYFKPGLGAHALWGPVLSEYLSRGGPKGALGYPRTRVSAVDGVSRAIVRARHDLLLRRDLPGQLSLSRARCCSPARCRCTRTPSRIR